MAVEDAYELAYREAVRALDHQLAMVTELRSRAGMLLAAASITVSLRGPDTLGDGRLLSWLAVTSFVLLGACVLTIVWPRGAWHFEMDAHDLLTKHLATQAADIASFHLNLVANLAEDGRINGRRLLHIVRAFRAGACLLAIQIVSTVTAASGII